MDLPENKDEVEDDKDDMHKVVSVDLDALEKRIEDKKRQFDHSVYDIDESFFSEFEEDVCELPEAMDKIALK